MPFDPKRYEKVQEVLGDPDMYPSELLSWMLKKLQDNPYFTISDIQLPVPDATHWVGGPGEPAFQNGWVKYNTTYNPPGFWKDPWGTVHLSGMLKSGTSGTDMFTLPVGYRPEYAQLYPALSDTGMGRVDVYPDGRVQHISGGTAWFSIDGRTFRQYT